MAIQFFVLRINKQKLDCHGLRPRNDEIKNARKNLSINIFIFTSRIGSIYPIYFFGIIMNRSHLIFSLLLSSQLAYALPANFVYLKNIDPTILQEMRYAGITILLAGLSRVMNHLAAF